MIRKTLKNTRAATFVVCIPHPEHGMPVPHGTCFFVSPKGYALTARHVIQGADVLEITLTKPIGLLSEDPNPEKSIHLIEHVELVKEWPTFDLALLKADMEANCEKNWARVRKGFPWISIEFRPQDEGTPVYCYGFPLSDSQTYRQEDALLGVHVVRPRTTSAVIAATREEYGPIVDSRDPKHYILDKALNYGNSGGSVVLTQGGKVISVVVRFQPVKILQPGGETAPPPVLIPSSYGISSSLQNIEAELRDLLGMGSAGKPTTR